MTTTPHTRWDVIIIGAGIAGLLAAQRMAKANLTTLLLERSIRPGGRAASPPLLGIPVNPGARGLSTSAIRLLQEEGIEVRGGSPKPTIQFVAGTQGEPLQQLPLVQLLLGKWLAWPEKIQLVRFLIQSRQVDPATLGAVSVERYLTDTISSLRIRRIVLALIRLATYSDAPERMSAGAALAKLREGVVYVSGGWETLVDQLARRAVAAGVVIRNGAAVAKIQGEAPELSVALKDGEMLHAAHVLSTIGPQAWLKLLDPPLAQTEASRYDRLVSVYAACLDLIMDRLPKPRTNFALGMDQPWYFANHSAVSSFSDTLDHQVVHVMKYLSPGTPPSVGGEQEELEAFLDEIQPGWRAHVLERRYLPRMLVTHRLSEPLADGVDRPEATVAGRPGLYVAGDWVGDGMLATASLVSAREAAASIIASHMAGDSSGSGSRNSQR
ncbi:hypothetical protein PA598K_02428 [Paenibacillus sp. 598K]|uniref:phytoene desaturase family protein n=1 Tax=Paenibacillus sp. 598K TaxID=1117987 RepID=UPI000FFA289F|nr:FAD-dependent oxidoreductase [Paenibacillus sp. 598K]GBF74097.1 hypothetical protein PA598K_02428 [Paenibacillus sp. 598K]